MPDYSQQTWADGSSGGTPLNAARLNHMEDGISNAATAEDLSDAVTSLTSLANAKVPATRTIQGSDLSANRTFRLDQWSAPTASVAMGTQKFTGMAAGTADTDSVNKVQMDTAVAGRMANTIAGLQALMGGKVPCIVPYDDAASSWHASTYAAQAADANVFFFFVFGVDDGTHDPFSTAGGSAWILFEEV